MHTKLERLLSKSLTTLEVMTYYLVVHTGPDEVESTQAWQSSCPAESSIVLHRLYSKDWSLVNITPERKPDKDSIQQYSQQAWKHPHKCPHARWVWSLKWKKISQLVQNWDAWRRFVGAFCCSQGEVSWWSRECSSLTVLLPSWKLDSASQTIQQGLKSGQYYSSKETE